MVQSPYLVVSPVSIEVGSYLADMYLTQLRASSVLMVKRSLYLQVLDGWLRVRENHLSVEAFLVERVSVDLGGYSQYKRSSLWLCRDCCLFCSIFSEQLFKFHYVRPK